MKSCKECGREVGGETEVPWAMCDREELDTYHCAECFEKTDCGQGRHGESCPTLVF